MDAYENLANAIIQQAAEDYFNLLAGFTPPSNDNNISKIEGFFQSSYFEILTNLDAEMLMGKIREEAKKMVLEYTVHSEKGSSQYYVCHVEDKRTPLSPRYTTKKKALHKAAEMQGLDYKTYMKIRKRDDVDHD